MSDRLDLKHVDTAPGGGDDVEGSGTDNDEEAPHVIVEVEMNAMSEATLSVGSSPIHRGGDKSAVGDEGEGQANNDKNIGTTNNEQQLKASSSTPHTVGKVLRRQSSLLEAIRSGDANVLEDIASWPKDRRQRLIRDISQEELMPIIQEMQRKGYAEKPVTLSFRNLYYRSENGDVLVNGVSGYLGQGGCMAVMGQGATTLFELLTNRLRGGWRSGEIMLNGSPPDVSYDRIVGLVTKNDIHLPTLTVRETLMFSSLCRSNKSMPVPVHFMRIELVMKFLGLSHVADNVVGGEGLRGISGGERRRLSIACEIVGGHSIIFADLPTNGLDSATALNIASVAKNVSAKSGYSHVWSLVQPSPELLGLFDRIILLSRGTCVYHGPPGEAEAYFRSQDLYRPNHKSVPDFLDELCKYPQKFYRARVSAQISSKDQRPPHLGNTGGDGDGRDDEMEEPSISTDLNKSLTFSHRDAWGHVVHGFKESEQYEQLGVTLWKEFEPKYDVQFGRAKKERFLTSWCWHTLYCTVRQFALTVRNKPVFIGGILRALVIAVIIGSVFGPDIGLTQEDAYARIGLMFFAFSFQTMNAVQLIPLYIQHRTIYYEQHKAGFFRSSSYYVANMIMQLPFTLLEVFIFTVIMYSMVGLEDSVPSWSYFYFFVVSFLSNVTAKAFCTMITALSPTTVVAQAVAPTILVMFLLFAGFMTPKNAMSDAWLWLYYLSFGTYAIKGLAINEYYNLNFCTEGDLGCVSPNGQAVLQQYDMLVSDENEKWDYVWVLALYYIAFNLCAWIALGVLDWSRKSESLFTQDELDKAGRVGASFPEYYVDSGYVHENSLKNAMSQTVVFDELSYDVDVPAPDDDESGAKTVKRRLLSSVFGFAEPGKLVALMGASGAGKSTLLDVIAGKKTGGYIDGTLLFNGLERDEYFGRVAGYVEQTDSHLESATVREAIEFSARLRLTGVSEAELQERVDEVIADLGLSSVAHQRIGSVATGGISPENRKKVTIAVEVVMQLGVLFLDEPTTGLASDAAVEVMNQVRRMARKIPVICTIHQPSQEIVDKFDVLLLLQKGGRVAYYGDMKKVPDYMEAAGYGTMAPDSNIADFALNCIDDATDDPAEVFMRSREYRGVREAINAMKSVKSGPQLSEVYDDPTPTTMWQQFVLLLQRFWSDLIRERPALVARLGTSMFMGFIMGTLFYQMNLSLQSSQIRVSLCFLSTVFAYFVSQTAIVDVVRMREVYFRESSSNMYSPLPYYLARSIADLPIVCVQVLSFSTLVYWLSGMTDEDNGIHFALFVLMFFVLQLTGYAFAQLCGTVAPDAELGNVMNVAVLIINMLFCGFLIRKDGIPQGWIWLYYVNLFRYPLAFFCANEIDSLQFECSPKEQCSGENILKRFDIHADDMAMYFAVSVAFFVWFRILGFVTLLKIQHIKR